MKTSQFFAKNWKEVRRIMSICSHPEPLKIFITANIMWIILGWVVRGAVVCDSTEQLKEAEGRLSSAMCRCCFSHRTAQQSSLLCHSGFRLK